MEEGKSRLGGGSKQQEIRLEAWGGRGGRKFGSKEFSGKGLLVSRWLCYQEPKEAKIKESCVLWVQPNAWLAISDLFC